MLLASLLLVMFPGCLAGYGHILSHEHLVDALVEPGTDTIAHDAVLVLYAPRCPPPLHWFDMDHHLYYLIHDYETMPSRVWYRQSRLLADIYRQQSDADDGDGGRCLEAVYLQAGRPLDEVVDRWQPESFGPEALTSLLAWLWELLRREVTVRNGFYETVTVTQHPVLEGPDVPAVFIVPGDSVPVPTYAAYTLRVSRGDYVTLLYGTVVGSQQTDVLHVRGQPHEIPDLNRLRDDDVSKQVEHAQTLWLQAERHLRNLKQPLFVHNYTEHGYHKLPVPPDLYMALSEFYRQHPGADEPVEQISAVVHGYKPPTMFYLSDQLLQRIERTLQPAMEEWCGCQLRRTAIYGIREYHDGDLLRGHVDRIETHVISAILQVEQDVDEDWTLEVVGYDGVKRQVRLMPGEMLFYESAKLVHGRPLPFRGRSFANAFVHFAPVNGWDYKFVDREFVDDRRRMRERLDLLDSELTDGVGKGVSIGGVRGGKDEL